MNLNFNLRVSFLALFLIILMMAVVSSIFFFSLGSAIDVILKENYQSLLAGNSMREALERQNEQLLIQSLAPNGTTTAIHTLEQVFEQAFHTAKNNITIPGEKLALDQIETNWKRWRELIREIPEGNGDKYRYYQDKLSPMFWELNRQIGEMLRLNQTAMVEADAKAKQLARNNSVIMGMFGLLGLLATIWFNRRLHSAFLEPLSRISLLTRRMQHGDFSLRLPQDRSDEFGVLAREINRLLERVELAGQESDSVMIQHRQIASALIEQYREPALILNNIGDTMLANAPARVLFTGPEGGEGLMILRQTEDETEETMNWQDLVYRVHNAPLLTASRRHVGTLVRLYLDGKADE